MEYQIKCLEYTDPGMRSDMKRMLRHVPQERRWLEYAIMAVRVLTFGLCAFFWAIAALVTTAWVLDPAGAVGNEWVPVVLWSFFAAFLLAGLMLRPLPNPIRDQLWPPETQILVVTCRQDRIQIETGKLSISIQYHDIQLVQETDRCFYLFPMRNYFLMLRKQDFIRGNPGEFAAFLAQRTGKPVNQGGGGYRENGVSL